jgi:hypothetical protein
MPGKRDISHLSLLEQQKIEKHRAQNRETNKLRALGLSSNNRAPTHLTEEEKEAWRLKNVRATALRFYHRNSEKVLTYQKDRYYSTPSVRRNRIDAARKWNVENVDRVNEKRRISAAKQREDPQFRTMATIRTRISNAMRAGSNRPGSAIRDMGCTFQELRIHLEGQFTEGMIWENYGRYGWHIDHVIPLDGFDLQDREQFLTAVNFKNLQPLWAVDNLKKGSKILY